jgi:amino-acid N-acetyltransferase
LEKTVSVRKARAEDIDSIYRIIATYSEDGVLLSRSLNDINENLENFLVADIHGTVAGVITFYDYGDHLKEVRSLAVSRKHLRKGIGSALLGRLIGELKRVNNPKIFVLTYAPAFFEKNGFSVINMDTLPEKIWKDCINCTRQETCDETALEHTAS